MYQFSRAIYRELAGDILEPDTPWSDCHPHERVLKSCEAAIERLATDRHYFARPARTLFNDIRIFFPMSKQHCVWHVVRNYLELADEFFVFLHALGGWDVTLGTDPRWEEAGLVGWQAGLPLRYTAAAPDVALEALLLRQETIANALISDGVTRTSGCPGMMTSPP